MTDLTQAEITDLIQSKLPVSVRNQQWVVDKATAQLINLYGIDNVVSMLQYQQSFQYSTIGFYSHPNAGDTIPNVGGVEVEAKAGFEINRLNGITILTEAEVNSRIGNVGSRDPAFHAGPDA